MKVGRLFPRVVKRRYPLVDPDDSLLTVLYLLRMVDLEAVPLSPITAKRARAVFGYSSLPRMVEMTATEFIDFLDGHCAAAASELPVVGLDDEADDLLKTFDAKRLGFAAVHDAGSPTRASLVTLADFLGLYTSGVLRSTLSAKDVASKVVAMPGSTSIRDALRAMIAQHHRRMFISGTQTYVSDRSIVHRLFDPMVLEFLGEEKEDALSESIDKAQHLSPRRVRPTASLPQAAKELLAERGGCLTLGDGMLVTPWDVVMKPWRAGALRWRKP